MKKGFTIIELIVVIVAIGIIATIALVGFNRYQSQGRDSQRESDVNLLAESLEKYYDQNGEYPSCGAVTSNTAASTLDADKAIFIAPRSGSTDNSLQCNALTSGGTNDNYAYVGDGSSTCQTGNSCLSWTIQYRNEQTGEIKTITSRRTTDVATSGRVSLTATTTSNTTIALSWNSLPNITNYQLERSTSPSFSGATVTNQTTTSATASSLIPGTRYYFRVTPYNNSQAAQSSTADAITTVSDPAGTAVTLSVSLINGNTARAVAGGVTCASGSTLQYQFGSQARNTNSTVSLSYGSWGTSNTLDQGIGEGYNHTYQVKARCSGNAASSNVRDSSNGNVTRGINTPGNPYYTGDTSWSAGYRYWVSWGTSCPGGTWVNDLRGWGNGPSGSRNPGGGYYYPTFYDWWYTGWNAGQVDYNVQYYAEYRCLTDFAASNYSGVGGVNIYVLCESWRRNTGANPRCDNNGQNSATLPWGS